MTSAHKDQVSRALASYYIEAGIKPKMNILAKIPIRDLLPWLQEQDKCWTMVTLEHCVTANTCINGMNTFLCRFKKKYDDIDTLMGKINATREADLKDNDSDED